MIISTENKELNLKKATIEESIKKWIEQDVLVPDSKPDALKIVNVTACPYVCNYDIVGQNKVKAIGKIVYYIIYKGNDENYTVRGINLSYPFTEVLELENNITDMNIRVIPYCKNIIYSMPNERKFTIKTEIEFKVRAEYCKSVSIIKDFSDESIQKKKISQKFDNIKCQKETVITSKDEVMLSSDVEGLFEILKVDTKIENTDYKDSYNKIMVKGDIKFDILYLCEGEGSNIRKTECKVPFSSIINLDQINEKSKFDIEYVLENFSVEKKQNDMSAKAISVEYQIGTYVTVYEEEVVEYIDDFYSQSKELKYDKVAIDVMAKNTKNQKQVVVNETLNNVLDSNDKLMDYFVDTSNVKVSFENKKIIISGNAKLNLIVQNNETKEIENKVSEIMIDEKYEVECDEYEKVYVQIVDKIVKVSQNGNNVDVVLTIIVDSNLKKINKINIIEKIEDENLDYKKLDSINIYVVKKGDTLWNIAKKFKTTVENIAKINEIENENKIDVGQKILVIR